MTRLAIVGAGSMGAQIAQQAALHAIDVTLQDTDEAQIRKAQDPNRGHLARRVEKARLSQADAEKALERVHVTTDLGQAVADADFVIEAVFENLDVKRSIFAELDAAAPAGAGASGNSFANGLRQVAGAAPPPGAILDKPFLLPALVHVPV